MCDIHTKNTTVISINLLLIGERRNSVYAWTLEVWERKGRMGTPKHRSEKGRGVPHSQKQEKRGHLHSSIKPGCFFCYWFGFQWGVVARGWDGMICRWHGEHQKLIRFALYHLIRGGTLIGVISPHVINTTGHINFFFSVPLDNIILQYIQPGKGKYFLINMQLFLIYNITRRETSRG